MGKDEGKGVGLPVLTKTVRSISFHLQHHWPWFLWRCYQTIECLPPCTPGTLFLEQSGEFGFYSIFLIHAKVYLISGLLWVFFWFWSHKCFWSMSVYLPSYHFVVHLQLAKSKETFIIQFEHHFPVETQMAGLLENIIDKQ